MENPEATTPEESFDTAEKHGLWLSPKLYSLMRSSARLGFPLMVICILLCLSKAISLLIELWELTVERDDSFYLLDDKNLAPSLELLIAALLLFLFSKGTLAGVKAWRQLKNAESDDDSLLEGTEQLSRMFRWLAIWGAIFMIIMGIRYVLKS